MNTKDFDTRKALLKSGKDEFLSCGFESASLRTICRKAGVTTGAFYAYFDKKEDLFSAIVAPMLNDFQRMYDGIIRLALADVKNNERNETEAIEFICSHRDEFLLLFDCSAGTKYEGFRGNLVDGLFMSSYQVCFDRYAGFRVDPAVVRLFVHMKFAQYMEIIYGGYSMKDTRQLIRLYASFTETGFLKLIEELKTA
ncbi:MAG: TetR/AcrR family transcriptional regulator [Oscillospiraceae bacterium]|nr:TetR/AcrR family transcriptional regulator [Oscillospiraceae bacterium]